MSKAAPTALAPSYTTVTKTLNPGDDLPIRGVGVYARIIAATGPIGIGFDNGSIIPNCNVGQAFRSDTGTEFSQVTLENPATAPAAVTVTIFIGNMEIDDTRLNIGSSTNLPITPTDPNFIVGATMDTTPVTAAAAAGVQLLAADSGRREVWLWTSDPANLAWFAESQAQALAGQAAGSPDFRQVGLQLDGFTVLRTRSAIWVAAANGVKVGAIVFKA